MSKPQKILVTGTAGFIGFYVANALITQGDEVVGIDCINDYYDPTLKIARLKQAGIDQAGISVAPWQGNSTHSADSVDYPDSAEFTHASQPISSSSASPYSLVQSSLYANYRFAHLDVVDDQALNALFEQEQFDAVCHLAAQAGVRYSLENPMAYVQANIVGFANILEACRLHGVKNLSYASSSSVYGLNETYPFSTSHNVDHPVSLYAASKKSNELMAHTYSHLYGIATTGLRFFTVYGPWGRPDMAYFSFTKAALEGKPIAVFNHGQMMRDFTYIDDIVEGVIRVIDHPAKPNPDWSGKKPDPSSSSSPYKVYNIGNNNPVKLMDFIAAIERALGVTINKKMMPMQPGDVPQTYANVDDLVEDLGYQPNTPLDIGIERFVLWYRDYYGV